jgi:DNA polymerase III alpha subunit
MSAYAELHCISSFSFLRGASQPEELVERALALEYSGLAITDECSFAGSVRAHLALTELCEDDAAARAFKLVHGTEVQLADGPKLVLLALTAALGAHARLVPIPRLYGATLPKLGLQILGVTVLAVDFVAAGAGIRLGGLS